MECNTRYGTPCFFDLRGGFFWPCVPGLKKPFLEAKKTLQGFFWPQDPASKGFSDLQGFFWPRAALLTQGFFWPQTKVFLASGKGFSNHKGLFDHREGFSVPHAVDPGKTQFGRVFLTFGKYKFKPSFPGCRACLLVLSVTKQHNKVQWKIQANVIVYNIVHWNTMRH